ncbi:MAG: amidohydrolase family protein, partial [Candidatus Binatia bacterium]
MQSKFLFTFTLLVGVLFFSAFQERVDPEFDLIIRGGRVMDPESRLDAVRSIGIRNGSIAIISEEELNGREVLDASGLVVAPGFIDLHAHGQDPLSNRFQAADGVTTAMDLEAGVYPVAKWYASRQGQALINFGAVVGHGAARTKLMHDVEIGHSPTMSDGVRQQIEGDDYRYRGATEEEIEALVKLMQKGLEEGGLGFGFGIAYVPGATPQEILRLFQLAAENQVPAYVHLRAGGRDGAAATVAAFQEVIANAAIAGTSVHVV